MDYVEKAILGIPIVTDLGEIKPLSLYDYVNLGVELQVVSFEKTRILHEYRLNLDIEVQKSKELEAQMKKLNETKSLKEIVTGVIPAFLNAYIAIIAQSMFSDIENTEDRIKKSHDFVKELDDTQFENLRDIILKINSQSKQKAFLDYELQRKKEQGIRLNSQGKEGANLVTMISSVVSFSGIDYDIISNWNYARLLHAFNRIAQFKAYDTTTMFMTVSGDVTANNWQENFEVKDDSATSDSFAVSFDSFTKEVGDKL